MSTAYTIKSIVLDGALPDDVYAKNFIWPSQSEMESGYAIANAGYLWNTQKMSKAQLDSENGIDKRGLYQFIVSMGNAPTDKDNWKYSQVYASDKWYTLALPYDMSVDQIKSVFGDKTQVCRISKVTRDTSVTPHVLKLEFRNSVMGEDDGRPSGTYYSSDKVTQTGIRHHHPYMIKPSGTVSEDIAKFEEDGHRVLPDYEMVPGELYIDTINAVMADGTTAAKDANGEVYQYKFCPILLRGTIKKNSYVLANYGGIHQFVFYKGVKNKTTNEYENGGTLNAHTAYVQLIHGTDDSSSFFTTTIDAGNVKFSSFFGDNEDADIDGIEQVEIYCGNDKVANDIIYTINGIRVSGESLAPGIYIKNGKKFIVK